MPSALGASPPSAPRHVQLIDQALEPYRAPLGARHRNYRNHAQRVCGFALSLAKERTPALSELFAIAAAFHDLGLWTDHTLDYLPRSRELACAWLAANNRQSLAPVIEDMIDNHRALLGRPGDTESATEIFRRAVLIEHTNGVLTFGLPLGRINAVGNELLQVNLNYFPMYDFLDRLFTRPLKLFPMLKWRPAPKTGIRT